jgi:hypothetical protein
MRKGTYMIKKLDHKDQKRVLDYLYKESAYNIFIIGDIETFGMETEFQRVYGEFDDEDQILSIFLRYRENAVYSKKDKEAFINQKTSDQKMGITLILEKDHQVLSSVATTAETTKSAMVVAVATDQSYRNRGYASILMQKLMMIYFEEKKKELCLFYDNPNAGKIYHRLGFETIGTWDMYSRK